MKLHTRLAWIRQLQCSATIKSTLVTLSCHADTQGKCWPSQALIAREAGLARRTVIKAIEELERVGIVIISRRFNRSSVYVLNFDSAPHALLWRTWCTMNCPGTVQAKPTAQSKPDRRRGKRCSKCKINPAASTYGPLCWQCAQVDDRVIPFPQAK